MNARAAIVPKLCGMDVELGNSILSPDGGEAAGSDAAASRLLLAAIEGRSGWLAPDEETDSGRRFTGAGHCFYCDLNHIELCVAEVRSAFDLVAGWHATLRIAAAARRAAQRKLPEGWMLQVRVNNSDGQSHSYGAHCNFLVSRRAWQDIFERRLHFQLLLASFQASSIVFTGQGKVGSENGRPPVRFQLAQRADFFETLCAPQTTYHRPLVNARDESLCGTGSRGERGLARLHCIFFDSTLCHVATLLKIGTMQIVLAMIEAGEFDTRLLLEDPVGAVRAWSHDPTLAARCPTVGGEMLTAAELQLRFAERAHRFVESGAAAAAIPRCAEIHAAWTDTLRLLAAGDLDALAPRLDWALKLRTLLQVMRDEPRLRWDSPELQVVDQIYGSLDEEEGIYWECERAGAVERVVDAERIAHFVTDPPDDTRAWTRAQLLRLAPPGSVVSVDWDAVVLQVRRPGRRTERLRFSLANPLRSTRGDWNRTCGPTPDLDAVIAALAPENLPVPQFDPRRLFEQASHYLWTQRVHRTRGEVP